MQAEALGPDVLAAELDQALRENLDMEVFERVLAALDRMNVTG